MSSSFVCRLFGKLAAAIVLSVERINLGELAGAFISVLFLEIRIEIRHAKLVCKLFADRIEPFGVLIGAYRESGAEIIKSAALCDICRTAQSELIAIVAARTALVKLLSAARDSLKLARVIVGGEELYLAWKRHLAYQSAQLVLSELEFLCG